LKIVPGTVNDVKWRRFSHKYLSDEESTRVWPKGKMAQIPFSELPLRPGDPPFSAWGLWGEEDNIGALVRMPIQLDAVNSNRNRIGFLPRLFETQHPRS
jgi:hypothetical protein